MHLWFSLCTTGVYKGAGDTIWVLQRGSKPWDAATFFSGGRAEHITDATPIRGPTLLQLKQVRLAGSAAPERASPPLWKGGGPGRGVKLHFFQYFQNRRKVAFTMAELRYFSATHET